MGMFSKIEQAQVSLGGNYLKPPGKYLLYVDACKSPQNRKSKDLFGLEASILESNHPECKAGMRASWVANLTDHDAALGNIKGCLAAILGVNADQIDEEGAEASVSSENPLRGQVVYCEVVVVKTLSAKDFSKHIWSPVPDAVKQKTQELRAAA